MFLYKFIVISLLTVAFASSIGCPNQTVKTAYVEGVVSLDGVPVEKATVSFSLLDSASNISAYGETDASGVYRLTAHPGGSHGKGAIEGEYVVSIIKQNAIPQPDKIVRASSSEEEDYIPVLIVDVVPKKYHRTSTSGLTATIVKGKNRIDFSLTSQ